MEREVFDGFADLAQRLGGMSLKAGSEALVTARVASRLRLLGLRTEAEYLALLRGPSSADEVVHFLDVISTGFTAFWREPEHFTDLVERTRAAYAAGQRRFRFWSAACSTGEEPYSMAMALDALFGAATDVDWKILASDLSVQRLEHALEGRYTEAEVESVDPGLRAAYLTPVVGQGGHKLQVSAKLKAHVRFRRLNLVEAPYPMRGPLDAIFCRNVMFYFEPSARRRLLAEAERLLKPGGVLYLGSAETLGRPDTRLKLVRPSVFVRGEKEAA